MAAEEPWASYVRSPVTCECHSVLRAYRELSHAAPSDSTSNRSVRELLQIHRQLKAGIRYSCGIAGAHGGLAVHASHPSRVTVEGKREDRLGSVLTRTNEGSLEISPA